MYRAFHVRRSPRSATMWLVGWLHPLLIVATGGPALIGGIAAAVGGHWWWGALGLVTFIPTVAKLRITAADPATLRVSRQWLLIPYERSHVALAALGADHPDLEADARDLLTDGRWEFECRDAATVLARLRAASADLATPEARTQRRPPR